MENEQDKLLAEAIRLGTQNLKEWKTFGLLWKSRYDELIVSCADKHSWKPIKTAPKDGREILACWKRKSNQEWIMEVAHFDNCWLESHELTVISPVFWTSLPAPPAQNLTPAPD